MQELEHKSSKVKTKLQKNILLLLPDKGGNTYNSFSIFMFKVP